MPALIKSHLAQPLHKSLNVINEAIFNQAVKTISKDSNTVINISNYNSYNWQKQIFTSDLLQNKKIIDIIFNKNFQYIKKKYNQIIYTDPHNLPFKKNSVSCILSSGIIHFLNIKICLQNWLKLLKPNGELILAVFSNTCFKNIINQAPITIELPPGCTDLKAWGDLLHQFNWKNTVCTEFTWQLKYKNINSWLKDMKLSRYHNLNNIYANKDQIMLWDKALGPNFNTNIDTIIIKARN